MIDNTKDLKDYLSGLSGAFCGMDLEADSLHRYEDRLCLIQYTDGEQHVLIDPLACEDLTSLQQRLKVSQIWMHGADYDMTLMRKAWDMVPQLIFDTQIAARLVGAKRFGYANLVEDYLGVELDKGSQKADWSIRPLTERMEEYALNDVVYLQPLSEILLKRLEETGRYDWFLESCIDAQRRATERKHEKEDPWRIKGSGKLSPKGLAYLRELWLWRESEAKEWDRPVFMVCGNKALIDWVFDLVNDKVPKLPKHYRSKRVNRFIGATNRVKKLKATEYPQKPKVVRAKRDPEYDEKVERIIKSKNKIAEELDIDSSLLSSRATIEAIVRGESDPQQVLMKWQYTLLSKVIEEGLLRGPLSE